MTKTKEKKLSALDIKLLGELSEKRWTFVGNKASRAYDLTRAGLLQTEMQLYSMTGGGAHLSYRPAFRRTSKGTEALKAATTPAPATPTEPA
jgi:hypothetical protein